MPSQIFKHRRKCVAGHLVDIVADITANGFIITAMKMFELGRENCEEFFEVYKGVVSEYLVIFIFSVKKVISIDQQYRIPITNPHPNVANGSGTIEQ